MASSRFQSNLRFALRKETFADRENMPLNPIEKMGDVLSWIVYEFKDIFLKAFFDPRFITVYFTVLSMIVTSILFYPSITLDILADIYIAILKHTNWQYVRFSLWILSEVTILGVGMRAFGRFTNQKLMDFYKLTKTAS